MVDLRLYGRKLDSIFELLGTKENDITYSLGWALSQSPVLLKGLLKRLFSKHDGSDIDEIRLQQYQRKQGITDVEIRGPYTHVIIEAKRGWSLPDVIQLQQYVVRLNPTTRYKAMVAMSECSREYAKLNLPDRVEGVRVRYLSWQDVDFLAQCREGSHAEKRLLVQFRTYLRRIVRMQNQESNMVYVVALASGIPEWSSISWQDIVNVKGHYFHPVGGGRGGWPKEPPNYIAFRYNGKLQSIHHIESCMVTDKLYKEIPEMAKVKEDRPYFLYTLGPPLRPSKEIRTGKVYANGRVWAMLDLLLTCDTISEARDRSKERIDENRGE